MMRWMYKFPLRLRSLFHKSRADHELSDELGFHLEKLTDRYAANGLTRDEARYAALRELGSLEQIKEECRDMRRVNFFENLLQDFRNGFRQFRRTPGFAVVAVLSLGLGIGANTAIFSVVYAVLLRPLPYANPDRLVSVFEQKLPEGVTMAGSTYPDFDEWRQHNQVFSAVAGQAAHDLTLTGRGDPSIVETVVATSELFTVLGVKPLAGRTFLTADGEKGAAAVVILSESLWRSRLGADPAIIGSSITLDNRPFTVVGIMPASFRSPPLTRNQDVWIPLVDDPLFSGWMTRRVQHWVPAIARLKPGVSLAQAQAEMDAIAARQARDFPAGDSGWTLRVVPLQQEVVGNARSALLVVLGAVGLVLLIACANVAHLLLARATARVKEVAMRIALGASRARIVRQLLTESAALGLAGGAAGVGIAYWGVRSLRALLPPGLPQTHPIRVDGGVLAFALLLSLAASFVFGLAPALFAARSDLQASLKDGSRSGEGGGRRRARGLLATAEIALAMILLTAAGLLLRSFVMLTSVSPGFEFRQVMKAEVSLPQFQYSTPQQWTEFSNELLRRIQAEPGLHDSAVAAPLPLDRQGEATLPFDIVSSLALPPGAARTADYAAVSPEYLRVMGIPLRRGRTFDEHDTPSAPRVALISETLAHRYFPNQDPIGRELVFGFPPHQDVRREIVGIVGDVRDVALSEDPGPMMYVPFAQSPFWGGEVVVRSAMSPASVAASIRREVHNIDSNLPVTDVEPVSALVDASVAQPRFRTWLFGLFGVLALVLAAAGIFGVISYSVSCRTREIGIRVALGAGRSQVQRLILGESAKLVALGLAIGIPAALALGRYLANFLFGVHPADPLTFVGVAVLLSLVALAASYVPTRRALRVDPNQALRCE
jgi:predicted permease